MVIRERHVYRGTTVGWPGTSALQSLPCAPTTGDPLVATLFAIECQRHGVAVVYLANIVDVAPYLVSPNAFAELEREVVVGVSPLEFVSRFVIRRIAAEQCRDVLIQLGFELPMVIGSRASLDDYLVESPRSTASQIASFDACVLGTV